VLCREFVDREHELEILERCWSERPCFVVVYGRRRIGKTRLVKEWLRGKPYVYYLAQLASHEYNLRRFAEACSRSLNDPLIARLSPTTLTDLLQLVVERHGDLAIVIDEFTYWVRSSPRVLSELQQFVDEILPRTRVALVVLGSLVGVMESSVLGGGSPLYGRARYRIKLSQLPPWYVKSFVPSYEPEKIVAIYALFGGIPFYLCMLDPRQSFEENLRRLLIEPGAPVRTERELLLREELRDPHTYNAVLSAIARGYDTPAKIAQITGLDPSHVSKYLNTLEYLGFVEREVPLFHKRGRYRISDPILRTWYHLIEPVQELLDLEAFDEAFSAVMARLDTYVATVWEEIVGIYLEKILCIEGYRIRGKLVKKGEEIDIALLDPDRKRIVVVEAKWSSIDLSEAERIKRRLASRAPRLVPEDYSIEKIFVAAKRFEGDEKPSWVIDSRDVIELKPLAEISDR